jgi:hypothetical protein
MTVNKVIRYTTKPECADENEQLIRAVFAELAREKPEGLHYAAFRLADGLSFLHVAELDTDDNPLAAAAAFGEFQSAIATRIAEGPIQSDAAVVGSYRMIQ